MLSNENKNAQTPRETEIAFRDALRAAKDFAHTLTIAHNPEPMNPHREREAPHPVGNTIIRTIRPGPSRVVVEDIDRVRDHNTYVSSLGTSGTRFGQ